MTSPRYLLWRFSCWHLAFWDLAWLLQLIFADLSLFLDSLMAEPLFLGFSIP